jgi:hypothetical protein
MPTGERKVGVMNSLYDEVQSGHAVKWGRVGRLIAIGGVFGSAFEAVGACAQKMVNLPLRLPELMGTFAAIRPIL